jgi:hypothetical protein
MSRTAEELASRNPEAPRLRHGEIARYIAAVTGADMVSFQVAEPGGLRLSAAHGLDGRFSAFFDIVRHDDACACGAALKRQAQIVIPDIGASPIYARRQPLEELRVAGVAACVSTPILRSYDNAMQGIFSILKADVWKPAPGELDQLSALGKEVAIALANPFSPQAYVIRGLA